MARRARILPAGNAKPQGQIPPMSPTRRHLLAAATAAASLPSGASAQPAPIRWQMASAYPDGNFHTRTLRDFAGAVERGSAGRLAIQLHSNATLLPMPQIKRGIQQGQVQAGEILLTAYSNEDQLFDADAVPFLVPDFAGARRLAAAQQPFLEARFARQGLMLLYALPWPPAGFYTQVPLTSLDVFKGSRFRTFSPLTNRFATLVGANPTLVQVAELAQAFATGVVSVMVTSAQTGVDTSAWDYARVWTPANFSLTKNAVLVSRRAFEALPADLQALIRAEAVAAETRGYALAAESAEQAERTLLERGLQRGSIPPEVMAGLREVSRTMTEEWIGRAGEDGRRMIEDFRRG
jgi:TRAP-type C4-dicarboxylate transport system substrate-binding protein